MAAGSLRKIAAEAKTKAGKVSGARKKELEEQFAANQVDWQQVGKIIGQKKSISERQTFS